MFFFLFVEIQENISLAPFSSFFVGGPAKYFCEIEKKEDLTSGIQFSKEMSLPVFFLGGGTNILFADEGFEGVVLRMKNKGIQESSPGEFVVEAGTKNVYFYAFAKKRNRDFSPFFTVPGTIGGAIVGNAGVPEKEIQHYLCSVEVFDTEKEVFSFLQKDDLEFSYRWSVFQKSSVFREKTLIWGGKFFLPESPECDIEHSAKKWSTRRKEKQPFGKTGGSFFKNPKEGFAGYFLEQVGMKGEGRGDAFFSEKHANFLINQGKASQKDILSLAKEGAKRVFEQFSVSLEPEINILDVYGRRKAFLPYEEGSDEQSTLRKLCP
jgi:UDP-N-acetylmuramate dehydrogenase